MSVPQTEADLSWAGDRWGGRRGLIWAQAERVMGVQLGAGAEAFPPRAGLVCGPDFGDSEKMNGLLSLGGVGCGCVQVRVCT